MLDIRVEKTKTKITGEGQSFKICTIFTDHMFNGYEEGKGWHDPHRYLINLFN